MDAGNYARISVGGRVVKMRYTRGLNIVAWDPRSFKQVLAKGYDTYGNRNASKDMFRDFRKLPRGAIIAIACKDSCARSLS
jgi:hypothetical protein